MSFDAVIRSLQPVLSNYSLSIGLLIFCLFTFLVVSLVILREFFSWFLKINHLNSEISNLKSEIKLLQKELEKISNSRFNPIENPILNTSEKVAKIGLEENQHRTFTIQN